MGEIIVRKVRGMNWMVKISLVLILTIVFSTFMYHGWYKPKKTEATITTLQAWSSIYSGTTRPTTITYDVPAGTMGNSRMLVVAVSSVVTATTSTQTCALSYGGQAMTAIASNFSTSSRFHTALYYLLDTGLRNATSNQLAITWGGTATQVNVQMSAAVFEGVNQAAPSSNQMWLYNGTSTTGTTSVGPLGTINTGTGTGSPLTIGTGDLAVEAIAISRTNNTTPRTISGTGWATGWSSAFGPVTQTGTGTRSTNFYIAQDITVGTTTSRHIGTPSGFGSMSAMTIGMLPMNLQVGQGTVLGAANAGRDTVNNVLDSFTMAADVGGVTVNTLTLTGTNFNTTNLTNVAVYRDTDADGAYDATDVLVPSSYVINSTTSITITFTTQQSVSASTNYLITVDIGASAPLSTSITGRVTAATGDIGTPTYGDTSSATLTIVAAPGLTIGDTTNPADGTGGIGADNNPVDGFTLQTANPANGSAAVDSITVTGTANFTAANITGVHVYEDNGTLGTLDGADVSIASTATPISLNATTITFSPPILVTGTAKSYLIVLDIAAGATPMTVLASPTHVTAATGHGIATPSYGDTTSAALTFKYPSQITSCRQCHGYPPTDATGASPVRNTPEGAVVGDHQRHNYVCSTCHVAPATEGSADFGHRNGNIEMKTGATGISGGFYDKAGTGIFASPADETFAQTNNPVTASCRNISCHGGNNPTPQWGIGTAGCCQCHSAVITRTKGVPGGTLSAITGAGGEFGLAWGHKPSGKTPARPAVNDADCIVCHLEGNYTTQKASAYHADGNIDLRDPDADATQAPYYGEKPITDNSGQPFTFTKFSISYAAGSRTTALSNSIADVISVKFCLACHDNLGATNTTARSSNGGTPTATMPFGGFNLGAAYTVNSGAAVAGGLIDVKTQTLTSNSSFHPVQGPLNKDYPASSRLEPPYNNINTARDANGTTGHTKSLSVVINCFDCHTTGTSLTDRTIAAHGDTATIRGAIFVSTPSLCIACHKGYNVSPGTSSTHGSGSAIASSTNSGAQMSTNCHNCHFSNTADPGRPVRAADVHGFNGLLSTGGAWTWGPANGMRPVAFMRNTVQWGTTTYSPRPYQSTGLTGTGANCGSTSATFSLACGSEAHNAYTPGGSY